jgi:hypothetical protein
MSSTPERSELFQHTNAIGLLVGGLLILLVLLAVIKHEANVPVLKTGDVPAGHFNGERALRMLNDLNGNSTPHPAGSEANKLLRQKLVAELQRLGYQPEIQRAFIAGRDGTPVEVNNIIAMLAGSRSKAVMLSAHYDSVSTGPGAADDGAGVVAVLEIARVLASEPRQLNSVILLLTDGEEAGMLGAQAFVLKHPLAQEVGAVVNLEARGSSGPSLMFETSVQNAWLIRQLAASVQRPVTSSAFSTIYAWLPNATDLNVFKRQGMPGVNFAFIGSASNYHTQRDNMANLQPGSLQHQGDNALSMIRALSATELESPSPPGNAVFFDVLGLRVIWWREKWSFVLALLSALVMVLNIVSLIWHRVVSLNSIAWGTVAFILSLLTAAVLGYVLSLGMWKAETWTRPWSTFPGPAVFTFWMLGVASSCLISVWLWKRTGLFGLWGGIWIVWVLLSVLTTVKVIAMSYLFIIPTLAAGLSALPWTLRAKANEAGLIVPVIVSCLLAAVIWLPLAWFFYEGIGMMGMPLVSVQLALVTSTLACLIGPLKARWRWAIPVTLMIATCIGAAITFATPDRGH